MIKTGVQFAPVYIVFETPVEVLSKWENVRMVARMRRFLRLVEREKTKRESKDLKTFTQP
jgi:hypothetical protein